MGDIVERLRIGRETCGVDMCRTREARSGCTCAEAADEIERLREAIRQSGYVFELLAPENHSQTSDAEMASLLSSISEKLSRMVEEWDRAALGEKE